VASIKIDEANDKLNLPKNFIIDGKNVIDTFQITEYLKHFMPI